MSQQAQNDYYPDQESLAFAYAEAVNGEIKDLFAAGADIVQIDEPYLQARPEKARQYGVPVLNRALDGVTGTTAVHICFGYAAIIHERPAGYSFLPELAAAQCDQISIETAQSNLDCGVLSALDGKTVILGVLDLSDPTVETPDEVAARVRRAAKYVPPQRLVLAPDCGMKYLPRDCRVRQAPGDDGRRTRASRRIRRVRSARPATAMRSHAGSALDRAVVNLSILKNGRARAVRFTTLTRLCEVLHGQPGDPLRHRPQPAPLEVEAASTRPSRTRIPPDRRARPPGGRQGQARQPRASALRRPSASNPVARSGPAGSRGPQRARRPRRRLRRRWIRPATRRLAAASSPVIGSARRSGGPAAWPRDASRCDQGGP